MSLATVTMLSNSAATRNFLWPYLKRAFPRLRAVKRLELHSLGSVQAGRGVVRIIVHSQTTDPKLRTLMLFANYDTGGGSRTIHQLLEFLHRHGFGGGPYGAPIPLVYSPARKLLVYIAFPGTRVRDQLESGSLSVGGLMAVMRQSAVWLKKFHRLPPNIGRRRSLRLTPKFFSTLTAPHQRLMAAAWPYINRELAHPKKLVLVHGDPHLANCIRGLRGSFAFIDFSESFIGSAAADIAMYIVHLDVALQPFFRRSIIGQAQRLFLEAYYGHPVARLNTNTRRSLLAHELRTAALFLRFTSDHHRHPTPHVAWMIRRFVNIVSLGTDGLRRNEPQLILAG